MDGDEPVTKRGCADPASKSCGKGGCYPVGFGEHLSWRGDGSHYKVTKDPESEEWQLLFHFGANPKSRVGVDWDRWEECRESWEERNKWQKVPVSEAEPSDIKAGLEYQMSQTNFQHIQDIEIDSPTTLSFDITFAVIPNSAAYEGSEAETTPLQVKLLSGNLANLNVPSPCTVAVAKQLLARKLQIPAFMQSIVVEAGTELSDEDMLSVEIITLVYKEPPMVSTDELFDSMVYSIPHWEKDKIFRRWHSFDTYREFPEDREKLREWTRSKSACEHVPLTRDSLLRSFDVWLELQDRSGQHPESFLLEVNALISFFEEYCYSPSLMQVYDETYGHDDDVEFVLFLVGRLRSQPQTLMVQSVLLNCWC